MDWTDRLASRMHRTAGDPVALAFFGLFLVVLVLLLLVWSSVVGAETGLIVAASVALAWLVLRAVTRVVD